MFCLSKTQYDQYQQHIQGEVDRITKSRDPKTIHKWHPIALVDKAINFTIYKTSIIQVVNSPGIRTCLIQDSITAKISNGPELGLCQNLSDPEGLTIKMSQKQLNMCCTVVGDVIKWTPQGCVVSADPILTVYRDGKKFMDLNDDLDIVCG